MNKEILFKALGQSKTTEQLITQLLSEDIFSVRGLMGSSLSFVLAQVYLSVRKPLFFVCNDKEEAAYYLNDLENFLGQENVLFFPSSYRRPYQVEETDNANVLLRAEVLSRLAEPNPNLVIISYAEALFEKVITRKELEKSTLKLKVGETLSLDTLNETLFEYHFNRVDFVTEPGEFSVRGGIVDVFSFSNDMPYRIEFFGEQIDSIRTFDVESQLSILRVNQVVIIPNVENKSVEENRQSFLESLPKNTTIFVKDIELFDDRINRMYAKAEESFSQFSSAVKHLPPHELFCQGKELLSQFSEYQLIKINPLSEKKALNEIVFQTRVQPSFNKRFELLISHLQEKYNEGYTNYIVCVSEQQAKRFSDIFAELHQDVPCQMLVLPLALGFSDIETKINCYTDHQILERYHKFNIRNGYAKKQSITLK